MIFNLEAQGGALRLLEYINKLISHLINTIGKFNKSNLCLLNFIHFTV